jgi:hypothetical protein
MADPFSYSQDVAPMQRKFFGSILGSRNLSAAQKQRMIGQSLEDELKYVDASMKMQGNSQDLRDRDLRFQDASLRLQKTRDDMDQERNIFNQMPVLEQELESIVADPDEDSKLRRLSVFGVRHANSITRNPVVEQAFRSATFGANKGSPMRPSITYGDLIKEGAPLDLVGIRDDTDLNAPAPATVAAKAMRYAFEQRKQYAADKQKMDVAEKETATRLKNYDDLSKEVSAWDNLSDDTSVEFTGSRAAKMFGTPEDTAAIASLAANIRNEKDDTKRRQYSDGLRTRVKEILLKTNPSSTTPTTSATTQATINRF